MVNFIKPRFLGNLKEFTRRFIIPMQKGDDRDGMMRGRCGYGLSTNYLFLATPNDRKKMKQRSHLLNKMLRGIVDRRDSSILQASLPPKREFILTVQMTSFQKFLYRLFLDKIKQVNVKRLMFYAYQVWTRKFISPFNQA